MTLKSLWILEGSVKAWHPLAKFPQGRVKVSLVHVLQPPQDHRCVLLRAGTVLSNTPAALWRALSTDPAGVWKSTKYQSSD